VDLLIRPTGLALDADALATAAGRAPAPGPDPISVLRATYKVVYEERTTVNRSLEQARAAVARLPEAEATEPVSVTDLMAEQQHLLDVREAARAHNAQGAALDADIDRPRADRARLQVELAACDQAVAAAQTQRAQWTPQDEPDFAAIADRIQQADAMNAEAQAYHARQVAAADVAARQTEADALTQRLKAIIEYKTALMAQAAFPVPGIGFDDAGVTYQRRPLAQASSAEQLRVSVALGIALNPAIRVMRVQDGSLLDRESLWLLTDLATTHDMQVWVETVDESGEVGVYIEDGSVRAVHGVPVVASAV